MFGVWEWCGSPGEVRISPPFPLSLVLLSLFRSSSSSFPSPSSSSSFPPSATLSLISIRPLPTYLPSPPLLLPSLNSNSPRVLLRLGYPSTLDARPTRPLPDYRPPRGTLYGQAAELPSDGNCWSCDCCVGGDGASPASSFCSPSLALEVDRDDAYDSSWNDRPSQPITAPPNATSSTSSSPSALSSTASFPLSVRNLARRVKQGGREASDWRGGISLFTSAGASAPPPSPFPYSLLDV